MRVLIAIEPRSYREVIGLAIQELRPHIRVEVLEPATLHAEVLREEPDLVLCSQPNTRTVRGRATWIEFDPYAGSTITVSWGDIKSEMETADLYDLLSFVDDAERRKGWKRPPGPYRELRSVSA
jgi:hypothetical protein